MIDRHQRTDDVRHERDDEPDAQDVDDDERRGCASTPPTFAAAAVATVDDAAGQLARPDLPARKTGNDRSRRLAAGHRARRCRSSPFRRAEQIAGIEGVAGADRVEHRRRFSPRRRAVCRPGSRPRPSRPFFTMSVAPGLSLVLTCGARVAQDPAGPARLATSSLIEQHVVAARDPAEQLPRAAARSSRRTASLCRARPHSRAQRSRRSGARSDLRSSGVRKTPRQQDDRVRPSARASSNGRTCSIGERLEMPARREERAFAARVNDPDGQGRRGIAGRAARHSAPANCSASHVPRLSLPTSESSRHGAPR